MGMTEADLEQGAQQDSGASTPGPLKKRAQYRIIVSQYDAAYIMVTLRCAVAFRKRNVVTVTLRHPDIFFPGGSEKRVTFCYCAAENHHSNKKTPK
jgi:hypothetical protein